MLAAGLHPLRLSRIYETAPLDYADQPHFLNMVVELDGALLPTPEQLLARLLRIEYVLGRTREIPQGPRTIDLDLLFYGRQRRDTEYLKLPHPRIPSRRFVLEPLNELVPSLVHPVLSITIGELLAKTSDNSEVRVWNPIQYRSR
jgi:2-amino-4-hydroxy-6-hydroxymethyldihydropteridine diphosphokinase